MTAPVIGAVVERMAPLYGLKPVPDDATIAQNPLIGMVADYDSPASKKAQSPIKPVNVPASNKIGADGAVTPVNVSTQPSSQSEIPLAAE